jgi:hypothetical protein
MEEEFGVEKRNDSRLTVELVQLAVTETDEDAAFAG